MTAREQSDEKYVLDLAAEVLAEPDYLWQHRFPSLLGDPGTSGHSVALPVDAYFPRHRLIIEYWERQHSAPVPIMDEGPSVSGMSRGHQRRVYDQRRQEWASENGIRLVVLDYRGFDADEQGRLFRDPDQDRERVARALRAAGVVDEPGRRPFDMPSYLNRVQEGCFICRLVNDDPSLEEHHVLWRDRESIVFLNRFPTVFGYLLVAPTNHREQVAGDFTLHEYLALQRVVHAVAEAVRLVLRPERVYLLSLGSQQANAHVHWHIVPCPPGLDLSEQQLSLVSAEQRGILTLTDEDSQGLVMHLRSKLPRWMVERETAQ